MIKLFLSGCHLAVLIGTMNLANVPLFSFAAHTEFLKLCSISQKKVINFIQS